MDQLPVFLNLRGRPVLLVGDGPAAEARGRLLESAGALILRDPATAVRPTLAFVVSEEDAEAEAAAARLKAAGHLVNAVDRPALCDFTLPAIVDRSPVIVAVGTGGASAGLAKALREWLEALLPASLGPLAAALHAARARIRASLPSAAGRRRALDGWLRRGGPLDPTSEVLRPECRIEELLGALGRHDPSAAGPTAELVSFAPASADPDDLTLRQLRWLSRADTLLHEPEVAAAVLERARRDAVRICCTEVPAQLPGGLTVFVRAGAR